jgi:hypothetical protein
MANFIFLIISLFGNLWIWRILNHSIFIGLLVITATLILVLKPAIKGRNLKIIFLAIITLISSYQILNTDIRSLTGLINDDIRLRDYRLEAYPRIGISIIDNKIWVPAAHWFEGRKEPLVFFRVLENMSETVDPNLYFFANHPRERVGVNEFEAFPYTLLPVFIFGALSMFTKKNTFGTKISLIVPIAITSVIGSRNPLGNLLMFPFIVVCLFQGLLLIKIKIDNLRFSKVYLLIGAAIYSLVLIQTAIYGLY